MVEYECSLGYRPRIGPRGICNECITSDCSNPIYDVNVTIKLGATTIGREKERLWSDSDNPLEKRTLRDYYCVLNCEGFKKPVDIHSSASANYI